GAMAAPAVASVGCWTKANWLAAAGEMLNEPLMAGVNAPLAALRVFPPLRLMLKLLKVAIPEPSELSTVVPLSVPVPLLMVIVTDTPGTLLLKLSVTCTVTAGEIAAPAVALPGCCGKAN